MTSISQRTVAKLKVLNSWLADVFEDGTMFSDLLKDAGLSDDEITQLKNNHLEQFLDEIRDYISTKTDGHDGERLTANITVHRGEL